MEGSHPTLPIKSAFSSQHVWLFGAGPGLHTASITICARFIRSQERCSTYGDGFKSYGHRNICLKIHVTPKPEEFECWCMQTCVMCTCKQTVWKLLVCSVWKSLTFVLEVNTMFIKSSHLILLKRNIYFPRFGADFTNIMLRWLRCH